MSFATRLYAALFLCLLLLLASACQASVVSLRALTARYESKHHRIVLICRLTNGDSTQTFYKPERWNYCAGLSFLSLYEAKGGKQVNYFPCKALLDVGHIKLKPANTVTLQPQQAYTFTQYLPLAYLRPVLVKGRTYRLRLALNHQYLCVVPCPTFAGQLQSNTVIFVVN
ncbi:MAG: hypothetical protein ACRYG7_11120 [Janthinobacterium lividum]